MTRYRAVIERTRVDRLELDVDAATLHQASGRAQAYADGSRPRQVSIARPFEDDRKVSEMIEVVSVREVR